MKVIKIGAAWCNGCLVMRPRWEELEKEYPWLETTYYDFDTDKEQIYLYDITSGVLPVFIFLDTKGKELIRLRGEIEKKELRTYIEKFKNS